MVVEEEVDNTVLIINSNPTNHIGTSGLIIFSGIQFIALAVGSILIAVLLKKYKSHCEWEIYNREKEEVKIENTVTIVN